MARGVSALLQGAMVVFVLVVSASNTVPTGSALGNGAPQPLNLEEGVTSTCTPRKSARWKVAILLLSNVVSVASTVHMERANLTAALPTQILDLHIAGHTAAVEGSSRALWWTAAPPLNAGVSVPSTAAVKRNAGFLAAPTRWSAGSRPANHMVG